MNEIANRSLTDEDCVATIEAAMEVDPAQVDIRMLQQLAQLEPFGPGNPEPTFVSRNVKAATVARMGQEKNHLKFKLSVNGSNSDLIDAPWFYQGDLADMLHDGISLDFCYQPGINEFNGRSSVQFMVSDIKSAEW